MGGFLHFSTSKEQWLINSVALLERWVSPHPTLGLSSRCCYCCTEHVSVPQGGETLHLACGAPHQVTQHCSPQPSSLHSQEGTMLVDGEESPRGCVCSPAQGVFSSSRWETMEERPQDGSEKLWYSSKILLTVSGFELGLAGWKVSAFTIKSVRIRSVKDVVWVLGKRVD